MVRYTYIYIHTCIHSIVSYLFCGWHHSYGKLPSDSSMICLFTTWWCFHLLKKQRIRGKMKPCIFLLGDTFNPYPSIPNCLKEVINHHNPYKWGLLRLSHTCLEIFRFFPKLEGHWLCPNSPSLPRFLTAKNACRHWLLLVVGNCPRTQT